jgi:hypothetical protein
MEAGPPGGRATCERRLARPACRQVVAGCSRKAEGFALSEAEISGLPGKAGAAADPDDMPAADRHLSSIARLTVEVETRCCISRR